MKPKEQDVVVVKVPEKETPVPIPGPDFVVVNKEAYQKLIEAASGVRLIVGAIIANGILSRLNRTPEGLAAETRAMVDRLEAELLSSK